MRFQHKKFLVILLASFLLCFSPSLIDFTALPASAYIHQQTIIRENGSSIDNLKDEAGNVWELIVWQEANQGDSDTYLRLVGCPLFQLDHNRPLQFSDGDRILFEAEDLYSQKSPAFHVAKYSVKDIVPQLSTTETLGLAFNLTGDRHVNIKLPSEVVRQWQELAKIDPKGITHHVFDPLKKTFLLA
ncbi:MAG: DUF3122 domain-containing protein [Cyanobacteria bacterium J06582_2]